MIRYCLIALGLLLLAPMSSAQDNLKVRELRELNVVGTRPMRMLGATHSSIDSLHLHESPTLSLGDLLSQSSVVFVKSYGRGTMATASFRGTSPSHTDIQWNGLRLNSPMLGQVDLSLVPSFFIDQLNLWHGASASNISSGALGGAITLDNAKAQQLGHSLRLTQSLGSYATYDSYLQYSYGAQRWGATTRLYRASSANDFTYRNFSKVNLLDDGSISTDYEQSTNRNAEYTDYHLMQELYYQTSSGDRLSGQVWLLDSRRGVPMLQTDQRSEYEHRTDQNEQTLRSVLQWHRSSERLSTKLRLGYTYSHQTYRYLMQTAPGMLNEAIHSSTYLSSGLLMLSADYRPSPKWQVRSELESYLHHVDTWNKLNYTGYLGKRLELTGLLSLRYRPSDRLGVATNLRLQQYGAQTSPLGVTLLADYLLNAPHDLRIKASIGTNHRFPTLNDLYYQPGGNPDLRPERSFTYDLGLEWTLPKNETLSLSADLTLFDSYIQDWILWLPTFKGYWTPINIQRVHNYGAELRSRGVLTLGKSTLRADLQLGYTRARNEAGVFGDLDQSFGKQLPYIPLWQAGLTLSWSRGRWQALYKYNFYSERFTTSSNISSTAHSHLGDYHMSELSLEYAMKLWRMPLTIRGTIHNLLNEEYVSVLHRPMPKRNYTLSLTLRPF